MYKPKEVGMTITKFCHIIGIIPTTYKLALTYEDQIMAIGHYLEDTVYPAINDNAHALEELQTLFVELKNYVDNYFDNLDVQEEINNKLDEMAEGGELEEIIAEYLKLKTMFVFDTVQDMLDSENLTEGSTAKTLGFYNKNDKGGAFYIIREITNQDVVDNSTIFALTNSDTLIAQYFNNSNFIKLSELGLNNNINTILKYAITNYQNVDIDSQISTTDSITIETTDALVDLYSSIGATINCAKTGFIVQKNNIKIHDIRLENTASRSECENNTYVGLKLESNGLIIDRVRIVNFYDGIGMYNDYMSVFNEIVNCTISYCIRAGLYMYASATAQKNAIVLRHNYFNKCGHNADVLTTDGEDNFGYGVFIHGGLNIACSENVYEYNTKCGLYIEDTDYTLQGFSDINGYYEQNKRSEIYCKIGQASKDISIIGHTSNRPFANVSNAYASSDIMLDIGTLYYLFEPKRNLRILQDNLWELLTNGSISIYTNINDIILLHLNDMCSQKVLDANNKLYIKAYANYQYYFPVVKNGKYKIRIKFADSVTSPSFGLYKNGDFTAPIISHSAKTLVNHVYEEEFVSDYDTLAMFYQNGENTYQIEYMTVTKIG